MKSKEKRKSKNNNLKHQTDGHNSPNSSYDQEKIYGNIDGAPFNIAIPENNIKGRHNIFKIEHK